MATTPNSAGSYLATSGFLGQAFVRSLVAEHGGDAENMWGSVRNGAALRETPIFVGNSLGIPFDDDFNYNWLGQPGLEILSNIFSNYSVRHALAAGVHVDCYTTVLGACSYANVATKLDAGWESTFGPTLGWINVTK